MSVLTTHIKGKLNSMADCLSRRRAVQGVWCLHQREFNDIIKTLGKLIWDFFASSSDTKTNSFYRRSRDLWARRINIFSHVWPKALLFAFPPFPMITCKIQPSQQQQATMILTTLHWPRQPCFFRPQVAVCSPSTTTTIHSRFIITGQSVPWQPSIWNLTAWLLSGHIKKHCRGNTIVFHSSSNIVLSAHLISLSLFRGTTLLQKEG